MSKINNKQRLEIYHKRKQGETIANLSKQYQLNRANIEYLIRLLDRHGEQILREGRNRYYSPELKQEIIDKVLIEHRSLKSTSIEYGLSNSGILSNWIKAYKENCYRIAEKRKGRKPAMKKNAKSIDPMDKDAIIKLKDEEILRLRAENEYLKN